MPQNFYIQCRQKPKNHKYLNMYFVNLIRVPLSNCQKAGEKDDEDAKDDDAKDDDDDEEDDGDDDDEDEDEKKDKKDGDKKDKKESGEAKGKMCNKIVILI
jgi:hypothetical protein